MGTFEAANRISTTLATLYLQRGSGSKAIFSGQNPIAPPGPIEALLFMMNRKRLSRRELEPAIGSRVRVAEVLNRRRALMLPMIRALSRLSTFRPTC
jgi:antitoxin component HigA of HigAB toxin-antitoxin module